MKLFGHTENRSGSPQDSPILAVQAQQETVFLFGLREENAVSPDDGRAVSPLGERGSPRNTPLRAPAQRKRGLFAQTGARGAPPLGLRGGMQAGVCCHR